MENTDDQSNADSIVTIESDSKSTGGTSWAEVVTSSLIEPLPAISPGESLGTMYSKL